MDAGFNSRQKWFKLPDPHSVRVVGKGKRVIMLLKRRTLRKYGRSFAVPRMTTNAGKRPSD
jgi:hypothetical protein